MGEVDAGMDRPVKVLIVDDQSLVREGLRELMKHWREFEVVGQAANGEEAISACKALRPDMVLMDVQMPVMDGIEATKVITSEFPRISVVMLTVMLDDASIFGALKNGAKGYVLKDMPSKELRERLRSIERGEFPLSGLVAARVVNRLELDRGEAHGEAILASGVKVKDTIDFEAIFTPREIDILLLVAEGYSNMEIGSKLYLGAGTVKKHLSSIMQKLELENRVQVATFAYRSGMMELYAEGKEANDAASHPRLHASALPTTHSGEYPPVP